MHMVCLFEERRYTLLLKMTGSLIECDFIFIKQLPLLNEETWKTQRNDRFCLTF